MWNIWNMFIILSLILKSNEERIEQTGLFSLLYSNDIISRHVNGITPCLVNILNDTTVSMTCSSKPSMEEVRGYIYLHVCRPQDIIAIKVACYYIFTVHDYVHNLPVFQDIENKDEHHCWCGEISFERVNVWSKFSNIEIYSRPRCDMTQVKLQTLQPHSFELFGLHVSQIDFGRLRQASIIVLHNSLTTPPSLLELVQLRSLRLLSLRNHKFHSILQLWQQETGFVHAKFTQQSCVIELFDLEIIGSTVAQIPDKLFTIISVKVSLSLNDNVIQTISEDAFIGLTSLRALYLNDNNIYHIHKAAFKPLTNLNIIGLLDNHIQTLDINIFINMNGALPFASSGMIPGQYLATNREILINITIVMNKFHSYIKHTTKYDDHLSSAFYIRYSQYVKHMYVNNKNDIKYSATYNDYAKIQNIFIYNRDIHNYLQINLNGNPLVQTKHPCFYVDAVKMDILADYGNDMPCFCNIGDSDRLINKDSIGLPTYINETICKSGSILTPGFILLGYNNITSIAVLQKFHKSLSTSTYIVINLSFNKISVLSPSHTWLPHEYYTNVSKTLHVNTLRLHNNGLTNILPGAWTGLVFNIIYMENNNLMNISDQTFEHLDTGMLSLAHNKIQYITKMGLKNIKNIKYLTLLNNMIHQLDFIQFPPTLNELVLSKNNLTNLHFYYEYITFIDFSLNNLTVLDRMVNRSHLLSHILNFHGNMITYIEENAFQSYSNIDHLDLSQNYFDINFTQIYFDRYFQCGFLNLNNNHITAVTNLFYHAGFRRLLELDLSHNYITEVRDVNNHHHHVLLKRLHMGYNKISYISPDIFQNMGQLMYADFKANRLHYVHFIPEMSQSFVADFTQNPLHCSCHLRWLHERVLWHQYKTDICKDLVSLRQVRVIDVPLQDFVCETPCTTEQCDCYGPHVNHSSLTTHVTCSGRGLTEVPHKLPPLIQVLDLSQNYMHNFNTFTLTKYSHMQKLILSYNSIQLINLNYFNKLTKLKILMLDHNLLKYVSFNQELKIPFLKELYLNNNNLKYIELSGELSNILPRLYRLDISNNKLPYINRSFCQDLTNLHNLHSLKLHGNDWDCVSCSALYFRFCLSNNYKFYAKVSDMWQWRCLSANSSVSLLSVAWNSYVCTTPSKDNTKSFSTKTIIFVFVNVILVTVAICMCPCLVFRIRYAKYFRVIFQHLSVVCHQDKTFRPLAEDQFDAHLVYDNDNCQVRHWVVQTLLQGLEQDHEYKIKIEERDGPVGCFKGEANYMAIRDSQRTIVVLSQHFDRDKWKQDAVDQAFVCWKNHNKRHKLIFVAYDRLLQISELMNELRGLVYLGRFLPCLYIDKYDRHFWRKIKKQMPQKVKVRHTELMRRNVRVSSESEV